MDDDFKAEVILCIKRIRKQSVSPTSGCPFSVHENENRCSNFCGKIFPEWFANTLIVKFDFNYECPSDLQNHPCDTLGKENVLKIMKKKFPELYSEGGNHG